jgi:hypothetical protein
MSLQSIREDILKGCGETDNMLYLGKGFDKCGELKLDNSKTKFLCPVCQAKLSILDLAEVSFAKQIEKTMYNMIAIKTNDEGEDWVLNQCVLKFKELSLHTGISPTGQPESCLRTRKAVKEE